MFEGVRQFGTWGSRKTGWGVRKKCPLGGEKAAIVTVQGVHVTYRLRFTTQVGWALGIELRSLADKGVPVYERHTCGRGPGFCITFLQQVRTELMSYERASTVALFGLPITNVTMDEAIGRIEEAIVSGETHQIATANLDFARNSLRDAYLQKVICDCSMVLPDGMPMIWASRLFGKPLSERVTGVDLIPELARLSAQRGYGIFLLGSDEKNTAAASAILEEQHPGVQIVGRYSPPVSTLKDMNDAEILRRIREAKPQILLVAFGNPKQEIWIYRNRHHLGVPVAIGIGGALEMIAGSLKRAPRWVQAVQMEWLFRMAQEPMRLFPRYARDAAALARHLPMVLAVSRMQPVEPETGRLKVVIEGRVRVVSTPVMLSGEHCSKLVEEAKQASAAGEALVVDMSSTTRVEADGLGCLLQARRVILAAGAQVWLAGMSNPVRRVLQFSAMADLFRLAMTVSDAVRFAAMEHGEVEWKRKYSGSRPRAASASHRVSGMRAAASGTVKAVAAKAVIEA